MSIKKYRYEIDELDKQILELLNNRARIAVKIGKEKQQSQMPLINTEREQEIIDQLVSGNNGPLTDRDIVNIYKQIIIACRNVQNGDKIYNYRNQ